MHFFRIFVEMEQLVQESLSRLPPVLRNFVLNVLEVERVSIEVEQRQASVVGLHFLPVAIDHQDTGSCFAAHDGASFRHHRHGGFRLAFVVNDDPV